MSNQQVATRPNTLKGILSGEAMREQFSKALPTHLSADRFIRCSLTALTRSPKLNDCTQESFMKCLLDLSAFGLEPDGRRAHLIPYGNQCTLIIDWKGLAELAMRSGIIAKLHADIVCDNDAFTYDMGEVTTHTIDWKKPRGEMYAAYAMAQTKTGEKFFAVMSKDEIEAIRKRSRAGNSGPWQTDYNEMAKKTAFRRLAKWLPLSAEFRDANERDHDLEEPPRDVTPSATTSKLLREVPVLPVAEVQSEAFNTAEALTAFFQDNGIYYPDIAADLLKNGLIESERPDFADVLPHELDAIWSRREAILKQVKGGAK